MEEKSLETGYVFESGRQLKPTPEDQSLGLLLRSFSEKVLTVLDERNLVIVGGESGLGKTEIFLGRMSQIKAGGIVEILKEKERSFEVVNAQAGAYSKSLLEKVLTAKTEDKPEVVLIDESGVMSHSEEIKFDIVKKLLADGRKVVLVGGGTARASEQNENIKRGLTANGVAVSESQIFEFPAYTLNDLQSCQLLKAVYGDKIDEQMASKVVKSLDVQNIPKIFRVVSKSSLKPEWNTPDSMQNFIRHIKIQPGS